MKLKLSNTEKVIAVSVSFTLMLLAMRIFFTGSAIYLFYPWNIFLGALPLFFSSRLLKKQAFGFKAFMLMCCWLLLLPNAPYLVTDIFHFEERPPVPYWYDLLIVVSGAWNGMLMFIISLMQTERFLKRLLNERWLNITMTALLFASGYGIYLGRYLRYNSWDVITKPVTIASSSFGHVVHPFQNIGLWLFTFLFSSFLSIVYFSVKYLPVGKGNSY